MKIEFKAKNFSSIRKLEGISEKTMTEHYKLYEGYVNKANEILEKLKTVDKSKANQTYSDLRELKLELSFAIGGIKNHELYFSHLGGNGGEMENGWLKNRIERDFGSYNDWINDMKKTGLAARGWVWLAYDWENGALFNYLGDSQNTYPVWNATPLVALDVYEHAYWMDYGTSRADYIDAFFANMDWKVPQKIAASTGMEKL
jgi:superoxide dismutase, Fe-Mn family